MSIAEVAETTGLTAQQASKTLHELYSLSMSFDKKQVGMVIFYRAAITNKLWRQVMSRPILVDASSSPRSLVGHSHEKI